ncbi:YdcF family protein [Natranaerobius thermophilus]|nr:YdcF family protein [Natranaerobius thermophilus]
MTTLVMLLLVAILILTIFWDNLLTAIGKFLVAEEPLERDGSYILVLQGGIPDRIAHGVELHQDNYAENILMVESKSFTNYELMEQKQLDLPSSAEINKQAAMQMGIDDDQINIIPGKVDSTQQEAGKVAQYLSSNYHSEEDLKVILVTSRYHSKRAKLILQTELKEHDLTNIDIVSSPSHYDPYYPDEWWKNRRQARNTFMEYLKLINFYTFNF